MPGGVKTILVPIEGSTTITTQVFCHAGSIYETRETNGLSHFLEHMFFKGGVRYPDAWSIAKTLDAIGADYNAYTSDYFASYYVKSAPEFAMTGLDVLADMIVNATFPQVEVEKESDVILQELRMYQDQPRHRMSMNANTWYYGDNPYGRPIIGSEQTIKAVSSTSLHTHQKALYTKDNLLVVIAGNIEKPDEMLAFLAKEFAPLPEKTHLIKPVFHEPKPPHQHAKLSQWVNQSHIAVFAQGCPIGDPDYYAAKLLSKILGGTTSSRLYMKIREELGLCYYVWSHFSGRPEYGTFEINAGLDKNKLQFGLDAIYKEIWDIAWGDIAASDLQHALSNTLGSLKMGLETSDEMADRLGHYYIMTNQIATIDDIIHKYKAVSLDQVVRMAHKLKQENLYTYWIE